MRRHVAIETRHISYATVTIFLTYAANWPITICSEYVKI